MHDLRRAIGRALINYVRRKPAWLMDLAWAWAHGKSVIVPNLGLGTAHDAIDWALDVSDDGELEAGCFLNQWRHGNVGEWPEFTEWLEAKYARAARPTLHVRHA